MTQNSTSPLLAPYSSATLDTANRIVMAPMTRLRADRHGVPQPLMATYYTQRASAGLIISEGIAPSERGRQYRTEPGLFTAEQVAAWSTLVRAVHATRDTPFFAQIMHAGRNGHPANREDGGTPEAPSAVTFPGHVHTLDGKVDPVVPKAMSTADVHDAIADHVTAARNAIRAGFDGVEVHGANSYLPHQFLADNTNQRGDAYGGSVLGHARFVIEVTEAVAGAVGAGRVALRLSPGNPENGMVEADPAPLYRAVLAALDPLGLAYLHLTDNPDYPALTDLRPLWSGTLIGNTGEHEETTRNSAERLLGERGVDLVSFGRPYISNPDLPHRIAAGVPWEPIREKNYHYTTGPRGYVDYPPAAERALSAS